MTRISCGISSFSRIAVVCCMTASSDGRADEDTDLRTPVRSITALRLRRAPRCRSGTASHRTRSRSRPRTRRARASASIVADRAHGQDPSPRRDHSTSPLCGPGVEHERAVDLLGLLEAGDLEPGLVLLRVAARREDDGDASLGGRGSPCRARGCPRRTRGAARARSDPSRGITTCASGSPNRALNSRTLGPSSVSIIPAYRTPRYGTPSASIARTVRTKTSSQDAVGGLRRRRTGPASTRPSRPCSGPCRPRRRA